MKSINEFILLNLVYGNTEKYKKEVFEVFTKAIEGTDLFSTLESLLTDNLFINTEARDVHKAAGELLGYARKTPSDTLTSFLELEELIMRVEGMIEESKHNLEGVEFYDKAPSVVSKIDAATYTKFYEQLHSALTYVVAVMYGAEALKDWTALPIGSFSDVVYFIDTHMPQLVSRNGHLKGSWRVEHRHYSGGRMGVSYDGYAVVYDNQYKEMKTEHSVLMPYIHSYDTANAVICSGTGYIVGLNPGNMKSVFEGDVASKAHARNITLPDFVPDTTLVDPVKFLTEVLKTNRFILSADDYVDLLNKYCRNRAIAERRSGGRCIMCSSKLTSADKDICSAHFVYNFADCLPADWPKSLPAPK